MNKTPYLFFNFLLLISNFSLSTSYADTSPTVSSPTEKEVRDAVVRALLYQEKKSVIEQLKKESTPVASLPDIDQKKLDVNIQALMKQNIQRAKLQEIVAVANKQSRIQMEDNKLFPPASIKVAEKKESPNSSKITQIASNKNRIMTPLIVTEKDAPKVPENSNSEASNTRKDISSQTVKNEASIKPKSPIVAMEDIPVGRNQLAIEGRGEFKYFEKKAIKILDIKQEPAPRLSINIANNKPEFQLNTGNKVAEGRNESVPKKLQGWIYLGRFDSGEWENKTLNVEKQLPQVGKQYVIKATSLYVRDATPKKGKMGKIIHAFRMDDKVKVLKLKGLGRNRDFYWAEILRQ